jgi:ABC-type transport system involved in multi-copper enzyme maturation permease subunit
MNALVAAELLKLRSTRTSVWLLVATLALLTLTVVVSVPESPDAVAPVSLEDPGLLAGAVGVAFGVPLVLVVLLGSFSFTQEFRYGTITSTYLAQPRRSHVLAAKWLTIGLASTVITTLVLLLATAVGIVLITSREGEVSLGEQFWQMAAAAYVVMAVYGVIGVAIGALVRNQVTAVVGALIWISVVEHIVVPTYPVVGRWLPLATSYSLMQLGPANGQAGELLSPAAAVLAAGLTPKQDVL